MSPTETRRVVDSARLVDRVGERDVMTIVACPMCGDTGVMLVPDHHPECPGGGVICEKLCPIPVEVICDCGAPIRGEHS